MPMYDYLYLIEDAAAVLTSSEYSNVEIDFGRTTPNVGRGGKFGMHIVVTTTFAGLASGCKMWIAHGAATSPTVLSVGRFIAVADMVAGAHFYVPGPHSLLRFARGRWEAVSAGASAGAISAWFGPDEDGAV